MKAESESFKSIISNLEKQPNDQPTTVTGNLPENPELQKQFLAALEKKNPNVIQLNNIDNINTAKAIANILQQKKILTFSFNLCSKHVCEHFMAKLSPQCINLEIKDLDETTALAIMTKIKTLPHVRILNLNRISLLTSKAVLSVLSSCKNITAIQLIDPPQGISQSALTFINESSVKNVIFTPNIHSDDREELIAKLNNDITIKEFTIGGKKEISRVNPLKKNGPVRDLEIASKPQEILSEVMGQPTQSPNVPVFGTENSALMKCQFLEMENEFLKQQIAHLQFYLSTVADKLSPVPAPNPAAFFQPMQIDSPRPVSPSSAALSSPPLPPFKSPTPSKRPLSTAKPHAGNMAKNPIKPSGPPPEKRQKKELLNPLSALMSEYEQAAIQSIMDSARK